ncbi:PREDICTED: uncharacterized protein LOC109580698 [Amphimedon queenslandica]|uniref:CHORD domain-containing protein n=1 Tax=Amphimedon queenslandica TaxID=400682 RepID=A0A1X7VAU9_AMPQE|nr:PREDICTED: uncharacterized protein LOC109580698 [Amphimedon queenslandica]|eukprot:XP_019849719.1 PREDICTED: uncharacterized protein LOC109580698 [Amphimedon queenslandica]
MATKDDIAQLKKSIQELRRGQLEILLKLDDLQEKLEGGGGGEGKKPAEPEPILTCVHCSAEYEESKNAVGSCYYHSGMLRGVGWDFKYTCCGKSSKNFESAKFIAGCAKGKHRSVHHTEFTYANYIFYMQEQV